MNDLHADFSLAESLIQAGLLKEIDGQRIKSEAPNGAVLITCGDKDRFRQHFGGCSFVDIHPLCLNGGGVLLGQGVDPVRQAVLREDCSDALDLKHLNFVLSLSHFPCGKCGKLGIGLREAVLRTLEGKAYLKEHISKERLRGVLPLISIDWRSANIGQEDGVKLYALRLQDTERIATFDS